MRTRSLKQSEGGVTLGVRLGQGHIQYNATVSEIETHIDDSLFL